MRHTGAELIQPLAQRTASDLCQQHTADDLNAALDEPKSPAGCNWIWISDREDYLRNPGCHKRINTWRGAAMMVARFECHYRRAAEGALPRCVQRDHLRMKPTRWLGCANAGYFVIPV